ncbi:hypothetical protein STLA111740_13795 [Stenotrophomonas lactitubi]
MLADIDGPAQEPARREDQGDLASLLWRMP